MLMQLKLVNMQNKKVILDSQKIICYDNNYSITAIIRSQACFGGVQDVLGILPSAGV